jgi:Nif-specific regulatory protein
MALAKTYMGNSTKKNKSDSPFAYLVIRDGKKWSDVFRLIPGRTVTIGRSPTNQIVIKEDQASRQHAEIFLSEGSWTVRDLGSRNGTAIGEERVTGDHKLKVGDVVWIAGTQMSFVEDLSSAYGKDRNKIFSRVEIGGETIVGLEVNDSDEQVTQTELVSVTEPTTITHRRQKTKFLDHEDDNFEDSVPKFGIAATKLCRLAFDLAKETTARGVARMALDNLLEASGVDSGSVMLVPRSRRTTTDPEHLEILAWSSTVRPEYQRVSKFLTETVLRNGEAVLARDIQDDSALGLRDAAGEIHATSVICAPIRMNSRNIGLLHLYSTTSKMLDPDDLEFTLAVAETVGLALRTRYREQKLVDDLSKTRNEIDLLRSQLNVESEIVGASPAMLAVHQQIHRAAPSKATVLVRGESGVGKELVARAVHFSSDRSKGPFVCLNCAALSESLLESELFGHEKGAFTGATERKAGKFESADKGTLMLDEIGEMSPSIQAKFLRVLEGHPFERVGGSKAITTNVRVIAATNRDLEEEVRSGKFRKDLFFRLHVVQIDVPPLRHRPEDIQVLADHFLQKYNQETGRKIKGYSPHVRHQLQRYRWPGNVRELKNVVERAVVLAQGDTIEMEDLTLTKLSTASESQFDLGTLVEEYRPMSLEEIECRHIEQTLAATAWNKSRAASILGVERSTLDRKIKKYNLKKSV